MIKIQIPGSTSNIGPGFDCLGIALDIYNTFTFEEADGVHISGCPDAYCNEDNLTYRAFQFAMQQLDKSFRGVAIHFASDVPISRGLGSSSTCILAGILAANAMADNALSKEQIIDMALTFENHPDNLSPALYGGMTASIVSDGHVTCEPVPLKDDLLMVAFIPNFELSTEKSRAVLPKQLSYTQSIYNTSRTAMLIAALMQGHYQLLRQACDDALHQPFRKPLIAGFEKIENLAYHFDAYTVFLSGAGPTIMAFFDASNEQLDEMATQLPENWQMRVLRVATQGARVEIL